MREIKAVKGGKLVIKDGEVLMIYEKRITKFGNGANRCSEEIFGEKGLCDNCLLIW